MLIHHFGSRDGLLTAVVRAVEDRQRALLADRDDDGSPADAAAAFWRHLRSPELAPQERLFFEVYGQTLQGRKWAEPMLEGVVSDWLGPLTGLLAAGGIDNPGPHARLALAVTRGLLLDLLATGETAEVDAAMELFARLLLGPVENGGSAPTST
ncbi:TetR/AcrR family transcriptional regulator [Cryptosporangium phraense]|uniref:TetR/AcrR family transcriptional regulator n=1 Tax=Cryptosporangium phraense TaxID=2593070 RepID=A0A545AKU4_9ACTN|nr:TetR/AcrR family transcriptional regulator [Cryptosporangium phraense]TQS41934.1 TetR/AcrR family transcriptional regulator [Cryptosporangium phraense]